MNDVYFPKSWYVKDERGDVDKNRQFLCYCHGRPSLARVKSTNAAKAKTLEKVLFYVQQQIAIFA